MAKLSSIGHNLVNASTPAYKREVARAQSFSNWMKADALGNAGADGASSALTSSLPIDHRAGTIRHTGQALDLAIDTPGAYIEVQTDEGLAYTRRGDLMLDAQGTLCDHAGHPLMGQGGVIAIDSGTPVISRDGTVRIGERVAGQIKLVQFDDPGKLERLQAGSLFAQGGAAMMEPPLVSLRQHHLEGSNVDSAAEMVTLIETMRHFEAGQRVLQGLDDMLDRAMRKLGEI
jgi:flagellar basal-body rod protein FlgF